MADDYFPELVTPDGRSVAGHIFIFCRLHETAGGDCFFEGYGMHRAVALAGPWATNLGILNSSLGTLTGGTAQLAVFNVIGGGRVAMYAYSVSRVEDAPGNDGTCYIEAGDGTTFHITGDFPTVKAALNASLQIVPP